jgi:hypothetical protein
MINSYSWNEIASLPVNTIVYGFLYDQHAVNPLKSKLNTKIVQYIVVNKNSHNEICRCKQDGTPYKSTSRVYNNKTYATQAIAEQALQEIKEAYLAELKLMRVEIDQAISRL